MGDISTCSRIRISPKRAHSPDTSLGGTEDITEYAGMEADGGMVFEFRMPLVTGDPNDKPLVTGATYTVLNSLKMTSDSITTKHTRKGSFTMVLDEAP